MFLRILELSWVECRTFMDQNLNLNLGHLEVYLMDVDKSVESRKNLRDIETVCETELQGSTLLRDLHILVIDAFCFSLVVGLMVEYL